MREACAEGMCEGHVRGACAGGMCGGRVRVQDRARMGNLLYPTPKQSWPFVVTESPPPKPNWPFVVTHVRVLMEAFLIIVKGLNNC